MHFALPLLLVAMALPHAMSGVVEYNIDWSQVSAVAPARPSSQVNTFGNCMCDVTDACDANCCCDSNCNQNELNIMFTSCDRSVAGTDILVYCYARDSASTKIVRSTQEIQYTTPTAEDAVCVVRTNRPSDLAPFYSIPSSADVGAMVAPTVPKFPVFTNSLVGSQYFGVGSLLPLIKAAQGTSGWTIQTEGTGNLRDPRPTGPGRQCASDKATTFMKNHRPEQCALKASLASLCNSTLNAANSKFFALTLPSMSLVSSNGLVGIRHVVVDGSGNVLEDTDPTAVFTGTLGVSRRQSTASATSSFVTQSTGNVCRNAIISRELVIAYTTSTGGASLYNATATYTVADVTENAASSYWVTYSTRFVRMDGSGESAVPIREGRPGYVDGVGVLAGHLAANGDKSAVIPRVAGLTIPAGGKCSERRHIGVRFGHNVHSAGCSIPMTAAELQTICASTTGTQQLLQSALLPVGTGANLTWQIDQLGVFADSSYRNVNEWVTVTGLPWTSSFSSTPASYTAVTRTCSNLVTGLRWVVGIARQGVNFNPQDVIVGARVEPIYGAWSYRGTGATSTFRLSFEVAFVRVKAALAVQPIVPPTILPSVDEDVFFPFRRASDQTQDTQP